jgi:hypothetical protein
MHVDVSKRYGEARSRGFGKGPATTIHSGVQGFPAERGALLRREGLYSSHISKWQEDRNAAQRQALQPRKRGPKPRPQPDPEVVVLRKQLARLQHQLQRAQKVIEVQKKSPRFSGWNRTSPTS